MNKKLDKLNHLKSLGHTLDSKYQGPLGFRFGWDGLLGLIPGLGDLLTTGMSLYIIAQAAGLGVPAPTLIRMAINVGIENLVDMIPVLGNLFDFIWKANNKNVALIEEHLSRPSRASIKSRMVVTLICIIIFLVFLGSVTVSFLILKSLYFWIVSLST